MNIRILYFLRLILIFLLIILCIVLSGTSPQPAFQPDLRNDVEQIKNQSEEINQKILDIEKALDNK